MTMYDLYVRTVETTGLDIVTLDSLATAVANCMADLTSRGYRTFHEIRSEDLSEDIVTYNGNLVKFPSPLDLRKSVYLRLFFASGATVARRYSLSNPKVQCDFVNGEFRSNLSSKEAIYYMKGDEVIAEWHPALGTLTAFAFGYYQRLVAPHITVTDKDYVKALKDTVINIRKEFEDALVFYAAYFYYSRFVKDTDKIQMYLANYKYYVEDITHELGYEDGFFEEDSIVRFEE